MKRLAGWTLLIIVIILEKCLRILRFAARVTRPVRRAIVVVTWPVRRAIRWARLRLLEWRSDRICRKIVRLQKLLARLLRRYDRLEEK